MNLITWIKRLFGFSLTDLRSNVRAQLNLDLKSDNGLNEEYWGKKLVKKYSKRNGKFHGNYLEYVVWNNQEPWVGIESKYKDGLKHGITRYYWKKHISAEGEFVNGHETGQIKRYFRYEDELKDITLHPVIKELADLDNQVYYEYSLSGKVLEKSEIDGVVFTEGSSSSADGYYGGIHPIKRGLSQKWFENGNLKETGAWGKNSTSSIYNLAHRSGEHIQYHENGNLFKAGVWLNKVPTGLHKFYYPNGKIEFEVEYQLPIENVIDNSFPEEGIILKETWYNEDGSLMQSKEIIDKAGSDPRKEPLEPGFHVSWRHESLNQRSFALINGLNFKRMGEIAFYESYYSTNYRLGHSYELVDFPSDLI